MVWALSSSLAATKEIVVTFFSSDYLDVSLHRVPHIRLWIHLMLTYLPYAVFPHSDIHGSLPACGSPWLFAACHVLHRRLVPGHPPYALLRLILLILRPFWQHRLPAFMIKRNWSEKTFSRLSLSFENYFSLNRPIVQLSRCSPKYFGHSG